MSGPAISLPDELHRLAVAVERQATDLDAALARADDLERRLSEMEQRAELRRPEGPPHIYVAGPLTLDVLGGTRAAIKAGQAIRARGWIDYTPHESILSDLVAPEDYETWMRKCLAWVGRCDALIRLEGESAGADREVARAEELGLPVAYHSHGGIGGALDRLRVRLGIGIGPRGWIRDGS